MVDHLSKTFGSVRAVNDLSFTVEPGSVTGFLGPNGAGKTTTLRMVLGLIRPTGGTSTIGGQEYRDLNDPLRVVGAALEASSFHPARTARNHLRVYCAAAGIDDRRADEVLEMVGLESAARTKVRGYSMGMRQRLGLAQTLLGDPQVLILDEPANGLDPEGIRWLRGFFRHLAEQGRTVLVSSHQLAEVQAVADRVVILNRGMLVTQGSIAELAAGADTIVLRSPDFSALLPALTQAGLTYQVSEHHVSGHQEGRHQESSGNELRITGSDLGQVGHLAFTSNVELHELRVEEFDLEQLFFQLTEGAYSATQLTGETSTAPVTPPTIGGDPWAV